VSWLSIHLEREGNSQQTNRLCSIHHPGVWKDHKCHNSQVKFNAFTPPHFAPDRNYDGKYERPANPHNFAWLIYSPPPSQEFFPKFNPSGPATATKRPRHSHQIEDHESCIAMASIPDFGTETWTRKLFLYHRRCLPLPRSIYIMNGSKRSICVCQRG